MHKECLCFEFSFGRSWTCFSETLSEGQPGLVQESSQAKGQTLLERSVCVPKSAEMKVWLPWPACSPPLSALYLGGGHLNGGLSESAPTPSQRYTENSWGQRLTFVLRLAVLVISAEGTLSDLDEVQRVNTHTAGRRPAQAWNVMGKRCPGDGAAKGAANPWPLPALLRRAQNHTHLRAHMYQEHLDTQPESASVRPEGRGTRRTPPRQKWLSLPSKGSWEFLEIL